LVGSGLHIGERRRRIVVVMVEGLLGVCRKEGRKEGREEGRT